MAFNIDNITEKYEALVSGASNSWEVYSGEQADAMAENNNIPEKKWLDDCAAMQAGQEIVAEELAKGVPRTIRELETRVRGVIYRQISGCLRSQGDDVARKGVLLHALQAASDFNLEDERMAELSGLDLETLQSKVVDAVMSLTKNIALPVMRQKCQEAAQTVQKPEQHAEVLDNPGALAVAEYMEEPKLRQMPGAVGACAGIVSCCSVGGSLGGSLSYIAFGCLIAAGIIATLALLGLASTVFASVTTTLLVEGTLAGIGGIIATDVALISDVMIDMLLLALGIAAFGGLELLLNKIMESERDKIGESEHASNDVSPLFHDTDPIVST